MSTLQGSYYICVLKVIKLMLREDKEHVCAYITKRWSTFESNPNLTLESEHWKKILYHLCTLEVKGQPDLPRYPNLYLCLFVLDILWHLLYIKKLMFYFSLNIWDVACVVTDQIFL